MNAAVREGRRFLIALGYFTRVPVPAALGWSAAELDRAARYFPLVGLVVGAVGALAYALAAHWWPPALAVALSMAATVLLTGAFHEDGLADAADGLGGGYGRERVLEIMHDSRIGSFGAIALVLALLAKHQALVALAQAAPARAAAALLLAHPLSRAAALVVMRALPYVRAGEDGARAKPVAQRPGARELGCALATVAAVAAGYAWLLPASAAGAPGAELAARGAGSGAGGAWFAAAGAVLVALAAGLLAARYFKRRLGGYTGDCLGATQQVAELAIYFALVAQGWR